MSFEPLTGWRELAVTERRRKRGFAHWMRRLVEEHYPQAQKIRVVLDNLSTHSGGAFYESLPANWPEGSSLSTRWFTAHG